MISFIVPVYNLYSITKQCIEALIEFTTVPYELIIVDNGSTSVELSKFYESLKDRCKVIYHHKNLGYIKASNLGAIEAIGDYLCIMNNDVIVQAKGWCDSIIELFRNNSKLGVIGATAGYFSGTEFDKVKPFNYVEGSCLFYPKSLSNHVGLFDETLEFAYCEDVDLCFRLQKLGYKIQQLDMPIKHLRSSTLNIMPNKEEILEKWEKNRKIVQERYKEAI